MTEGRCIMYARHKQPRSPRDDGPGRGDVMRERDEVGGSRRGAMGRPLERIHRVSLRDRIVTAIRDAIIQGKFKPGEKVPEQELAEQLGVSRTPLREAIRILEQQGLLETRPKNGTFIAKVDRREARDGLLVRTALEELAVRQGIERMGPGQWDELCEQLEGLLHGMSEAVRRGDPVTATELDIEWHTVLIHAAENRYLSQAWRCVGLPFLIWSPERELYPQSPEEWIVGFTERHAELLDALRSRDPEACAEAVRLHIARKLLDLERDELERAGASRASEGTGKHEVRHGRRKDRDEADRRRRW